MKKNLSLNEKKTNKIHECTKMKQCEFLFRIENFLESEKGHLAFEIMHY